MDVDKHQNGVKQSLVLILVVLLTCQFKLV